MRGRLQRHSPPPLALLTHTRTTLQVAASVLFLLSPAAAFITGACMCCGLFGGGYLIVPSTPMAFCRPHHACGRRIEPLCVAVANPTTHRHATVRRPARGTHQCAGCGRQRYAQVQAVRACFKSTIRK